MKRAISKVFTEKYRELKREKLILLLIFSLFSILLVILSFPYDVLFYYDNLKIGYKSDRNIIALRDYYALDIATYEKRKEKVLKGSPLIIDVDTDLTDREVEIFNEAFERMRKWSSSYSYQQFGTDPEKMASGYEMFVKSFQLKDDVQDAFLFLWSQNFSQSLQEELINVIKEVLEKGFIEPAIRVDRKIVKRLIPEYTETYTDRTLLINGREDLKAFVTSKIEKNGSFLWKRHGRSIINFLVSYIGPNAIVNHQETQKREAETLSKIAPTYTVIKKGEYIVRKGEIIQQALVEKLNIIKREELKKLNPLRILLAFLMFLTFCYLFYEVSASSVKKFANDLKSALFIVVTLGLSILFVHVFLLFGINISFDYNFYPYILVFLFPYAITGMQLRLFLNTETAIISVFLMTILLGIHFPNNYFLLLYAFSSALMGVHFIGYLYTRGDLLKAGLKVGLGNVFIMLLIFWFALEKEEFILTDKMLFIGGIFVSGFISSVVLMMVTPIFEYFFGYTTNITLFELSNLDNPLLKELMLKAPGTYNHSILIANLTEAAARAIKVNPLLARVSAYYHDIGKIKKPEFFIENQMGGYNKHEDLTPYMSVLVVLSHVKDGIEIAKEHHLGQPIIDAIAQHHGTRLVTYFYAKALKLDPNVKEENFRYLGPKPKTREIGLLMMADAVEAACRVLENPSPSRIQNLVKKIIQDIFLDGQLDECELTLRDLNLIEESFTRTLLGIYHHRIDYPEIKTGKTNGNGKKSV